MLSLCAFNQYFTSMRLHACHENPGKQSVTSSGWASSIIFTKNTPVTFSLVKPQMFNFAVSLGCFFCTRILYKIHSCDIFNHKTKLKISADIHAVLLRYLLHTLYYLSVLCHYFILILRYSTWNRSTWNIFKFSSIMRWIVGVLTDQDFNVL